MRRSIPVVGQRRPGRAPRVGNLHLSPGPGSRLHGPCAAAQRQVASHASTLAGAGCEKLSHLRTPAEALSDSSSGSNGSFLRGRRQGRCAHARTHARGGVQARRQGLPAPLGRRQRGGAREEHGARRAGAYLSGSVWGASSRAARQTAPDTAPSRAAKAASSAPRACCCAARPSGHAVRTGRGAAARQQTGRGVRRWCTWRRAAPPAIRLLSPPDPVLLQTHFQVRS